MQCINLTNFVCWLGWAKGCPECWQNIILGCVYESVSVTFRSVATHSSMLPWVIPWTEEPMATVYRIAKVGTTKRLKNNKTGKDHFPQGGGHAIPRGPKQDKKANEGRIHAWLELGRPSLLPLDSAPPGSQVFRHGLKFHQRPSWVFSIGSYQHP